MSKSNTLLRKAVSLALGIPVLIIGIILIPLPGPGLLVCLLGLYILAREFTWAEKHFEKVKLRTRDIIEKSKQKANSN